MQQNTRLSKLVERSANGVKVGRKVSKVLPIGMGATITLLVIVYVCSLLFNRYGNFTVSVIDKNHYKNAAALSLCEDESFMRATSVLRTHATQDMTNIDGNTLPSTLNDGTGLHSKNGDNYMAYTFFLTNSGAVACNYSYSLVINMATAGVDAAARVRLYFNPDYYKAADDVHNYSNDYVDYAKPKTNGGGAPEIDPDNRAMINFVSNSVITEGVVRDFAPGDIAKITVVVWLEGNDPDCTDDVLGGQFKLDMLMTILDDEQSQE